jgi:hypothetical protein
MIREGEKLATNSLEGLWVVGGDRSRFSMRVSGDDATSKEAMPV